MFVSLLNKQRKAVFKAIDNDSDPLVAISDSNSEWLEAMDKTAMAVARDFAGTVVVDKRSDKLKLETRDVQIDAEIDEYLVQESMMLEDLSKLEATTIQAILEQIADGLVEGKSTEAVKQAILDAGIFSEARALMLARTLTGTAASIGQISGAKLAGATIKIWLDSGFEVREQHQARDGEIVDIDGKFSDQFGNGRPPRFPLDPDTSAADRINCRCAMSFS